MKILLAVLSMCFVMSASAQLRTNLGGSSSNGMGNENSAWNTAQREKYKKQQEEMARAQKIQKENEELKKKQEKAKQKFLDNFLAELEKSSSK